MSSRLSTTSVNFLDLASAAVACTVTAANAIQKQEGKKNTRLKTDGSFVTDADFIAQGVICKAIQSISTDITIIGEESPEEMAQHIDSAGDGDSDILQRTKQELQLRLQYDASSIVMPLAPQQSTSATLEDSNKEEEEFMIDASRIRVIVDPLDGTKSYAQGEYDCVSILIGIIVDNEPWFGVIGKPFGYTGLTPIGDSDCVTIYGGTWLKGVYVAGASGKVERTPCPPGELPRAVVSGSRSKGVVYDFCVHLGQLGLTDRQPMRVNGAGEKSLRCMLPRVNEALWFFPKPGTSRWDVAAPDALLRAMGGRLTDKFGNNMDYSKPRDQAENDLGVVACIDPGLHAECIRLFQQDDWSKSTLSWRMGVASCSLRPRRLPQGPKSQLFNSNPLTHSLATIAMFSFFHQVQIVGLQTSEPKI